MCELIWPCSQSPESVRWVHRRQLLRCIAQAAVAGRAVVCRPDTDAVVSPSVTPETEVDEVALLLRDQRLVRATASGRVVSVLAGMIAPFLPECCVDPECVTAQPYFERLSVW